MNTTKNDVSQSVLVSEGKSVHTPSASSLALLRSQFATDDHSSDQSVSNETVHPEDARDSQKSMVGKIMPSMTLPLRIPLDFARTRPWLSSVLVTCLILVYIVIMTPVRKQNNDELEAFDLGVVTRYPEQSDQKLSQVQEEVKGTVIPANVEQDGKIAAKSNTHIAVIDEKFVTDRKESPRTSPILLNKPFEERKVASNTQNGAWLTGNIETIEQKSIQKTVRQESKPKRHRIVLLPRIRK